MTVSDRYFLRPPYDQVMSAHILRGGTVVNVDGQRRADVVVDGDRIVDVVESGAEVSGASAIDVSGCLLVRW